MKRFLKKSRRFLSDILFPRFCLNCQREGDLLCQDCFSLIDVLKDAYCPFCRPPKMIFGGRTCHFCKKNKKLAGLFAAASYHNFIIKKTVNQFKYEPFVRELAKPLSSLIIQHFQLLSYAPPFFRDRSDFILIPVPLHEKRLKWRGFNQAEEISKHLCRFLKIPLIPDVLLRIKNNEPQLLLSKEQRENNIKGVFTCPDKNPVKRKKILLIDDVFTTGSTMEECARVLKTAGAKEVWGIAVARE